MTSNSNSSNDQVSISLSIDDLETIRRLNDMILRGHVVATFDIHDAPFHHVQLVRPSDNLTEQEASSGCTLATYGGAILSVETVNASHAI